MKRLLLTLCLMTILVGRSFAQDVSVSAEVPDETVKVGKPFTLDLMMKVPYGYFVEWAEFGYDTLSEQVDILRRGEVVRTADADSNIIVQQQLTLMTFDTGFVTVPSVGLTYARSVEDKFRMKAYTDPVRLHVSTITVDTTQGYKPLMPPIERPVTAKEVFPWLLALLLLVIAGFVIRFVLRHRKPKVDENGEPLSGPSIPAYDKAIDDLASLRQQKLWQAGKVKEYYSSLTDIAREYIEGQFDINAVEMTTDDILDEVRKLRFDEQLYGKLKETMEVADLVKFAKYTATSLENDQAMNDMTDFVNESHAHYMDMKAKEEEEARQHV